MLTVGEPADVGAAIALVEDFYERHAAPPVFLVSDASTPSAVAVELAEHGYVEDAWTWIVHRDVDQSSPRTIRSLGWAVGASDAVTDEWFDAYWAVEEDRRGPDAAQIFRDVLLQPALPTRFVTIGEQRSVMAVGQVVVAGPWACVQCLATVPASRRRGAGTAVVEVLTREAASLGARAVFGAVMADNRASLRLFDRLGYERSHRYRYLVR